MLLSLLLSKATFSTKPCKNVRWGMRRVLNLVSERWTEKGGAEIRI